jgi:hypothetical protein
MALGALLLSTLILTVLLAHRSRRPAGTGSGVAATQARSVAPFTGVDLAGYNSRPKPTLHARGESVEKRYRGHRCRSP